MTARKEMEIFIINNYGAEHKSKHGQTFSLFTVNSD
jgi:hypothetical protein